MYLRILKKDLKRKRTMNIILLLFVILATMFVSSSVNNILTVTSALDGFFDKAGVKDYFVATRDTPGTPYISKVLDEIEVVDSYEIEHIIYTNPDNYIYEGKQIESISNSLFLQAFEDSRLTFFDSDNKPIESVEEGKIYISGQKIWSEVEIGDTLEIQMDDISAVFEIAGGFKDAPLGSDMMGNTRVIISEKDYEKFAADETIRSLYGGSLCYIETDDIKELEQQLGMQDSNIIFMNSREVLKMTYVMDMVIAGVLLVVSVCLILIAFVVLRFTISFVLEEEYREIGVMKAIGIGSVKIRSLYMIKYFMLAAVGAAIGFLAGIPFGKMLLDSVSKTMVMETKGGLIINILCSLGVVAVILIFCFGCTGKLNRFTPVDAIRNGTTGERFGKKGILRLYKSRVKPAAFLAANDVLSSPRRYAAVTVTFTLCLLLVLILVNSVNTLKSPGLVNALSLSRSDVYMDSGGTLMPMLCENGRKLIEDELAQIEETLAENGMPAECSIDIIMNFPLLHGDNICKSRVTQGIGTTADEYVYYEGTPPQNAGEIAVTKLVAWKLDAGIGDKVIIRQYEGEREYIITALFQSMNNMGEDVRLHESAEASLVQSVGYFSFQIDFTDEPDDKEIENRIEKIKEIYETDNVYNAGDYVDTIIGVSGILDNVRELILLVAMIIILLVTVLMERSFIARERGEIAILKAMGFGTGTIVAWHTLRFALVSVISTVIALLLMLPATKLSIDPIFKMMGADYGIEYEIVPMEVYLVYPLIVLAVTVVGAFFTALYTRTISASESSGIE